MSKQRIKLTERELSERIDELEKQLDKKDYALSRLRKGGEFCKSCNGSGLYMNRNSYFENCFTCSGIGVTLANG